MKHRFLITVFAFLPIGISHGAVVLTAGATVPTTGANDQFTLVDNATIPGGTFNGQAFSDNTGPPGQTFTTGSASTAGYFLTAFSFKGASAAGGNYGGMSAATTWGVRVSSVSGTTLTSVGTVTGILHPFATATGDSWYTWTFTGTDLLTLSPSTTYAFEAYSSAGFIGFDAATDPASYPGGVAFNTTSTARSFSNNTLQDRGYDRTFVANLQAVPEPSSSLLLFGGIALASRRRR